MGERRRECGQVLAAAKIEESIEAQRRVTHRDCADWRARLRQKLEEATERMRLIRATAGARRSVADAIRLLDDRAPCCGPREPRRPQPDETETLL